MKGKNRGKKTAKGKRREGKREEKGLILAYCLFYPFSRFCKD